MRACAKDVALYPHMSVSKSVFRVGGTQWVVLSAGVPPPLKPA